MTGCVPAGVGGDAKEAVAAALVPRLKTVLVSQQSCCSAKLPSWDQWWIISEAKNGQ
jgi:hypothetical protein